MKTIPVSLYGYRRIGGNECSMTIHSLVEMDGDDIKYLDTHRGMYCFLTVTDNPVGLEMPDLDVEKLKASMVENKIYDKDISPSERQRRKIWVLANKKLGRKPTEEEFQEFYLEQMDLIDGFLKRKIEELDND